MSLYQKLRTINFTKIENRIVTFRGETEETAELEFKEQRIPVLQDANIPKDTCC